MSLFEFEENTGFERYALARGIPLLERSADTASVDLRSKHIKASLHLGVNVSINVNEYVGGRAPSEPIETGLRPLFFGAAWKVLDLLIEHALDQDGQTPDQKRGWSITTKVRQAGANLPAGTPFDAHPEVWLRLCKLYAATGQCRHSLVHNRAEVKPDGSLQGYDSAGQALPLVMTTDQQLAFCRLMQRVATAVISGTIDLRDLADLMWQINQLGLHHGLPDLPGDRHVVGQAVLVIDQLDHVEGGGYQLDIPRLKTDARSVFQQADFFDVRITVPDRSEIEFVGRLEEAPDLVMPIDVDDPPGWLKRT